MEQLTEIWQYLLDHPEVTWSGAGLTVLVVLYSLMTKLLGPLFGRGRGGDAGVRVDQRVKGDGNIVSGTGDIKVERR